jgi:hypothetical protein
MTSDGVVFARQELEKTLYPCRLVIAGKALTENRSNFFGKNNLLIVMQPVILSSLLAKN